MALKMNSAILPDAKSANAFLSITGDHREPATVCALARKLRGARTLLTRAITR
jgi:hypothetical protein